MNTDDLRSARLTKGLNQTEAGRRLGVSQPYLAMLERGQRRLPPELALRMAKVYDVPPAAVPPSPQPLSRRLSHATLAKDLAALDYSAFAYLRPRSWKPKNPGEVLLAALAEENLEPRLVEALPWLALRYWDLDWTWVVREAKVHDLQNRLGFVVCLARRLAEREGDERKRLALRALEQQLERSRLAREDTLCRGRLSAAERRWLTAHRSADARHWNLLTDWTAEALRYVA